jgi:Transposase
VLNSIDTGHVVGHRDKALLVTLAYTFARIGAVVNLKVEDYFQTGKRSLTRFKENGGEALRQHGGDPSQIDAIAMDMSASYLKGATQYFPQARIVFDKFHAMVLAGQALDEVRRQLQREEPSSKGRCGACAATLGISP